MKKILIFSIVYYPYVGGAEVAIKNITDRMTEFEFDMITLKFDSSLPDYEKIGNVGVYRIGLTTDNPQMSDLVKWPHTLNKLLFPIMASLKASRLHRTNKYEATWAMMAAFAGFAALFFKILHRKVPYILSLQEGDPIDVIKRKVRFAYPLFKMIFTKADIILALSNYLAQFANDMGFRGELHVIPNAVDYKHFSQEYSESEISEIKKKLNKKKEDIFLVHTGRFVLKNAMDDVIKALKFLDDRVKLLLIGSGPDEEMLKELALNEGVINRVNFIGFIDHRDMPLYLRASDIFIRPSLTEGFGCSFVEAMAANIPVIATPVGGIVDFLFDPEKNPDKISTGLFCEVRDPKSISEKINFLLNNNEKKEQIVANAKKMVKEKYDWNIISHSMSKLFSEVIKEAKI